MKSCLPLEVDHNQIVVDLRKVQWAKLFWVNQIGSVRNTKPLFTTVNGQEFKPNDLAAYHHLYPGETMLERAIRLDLIDKWTPVLRLQLSANHTLEYTGTKALSLWEAWKGRIFGKKNQLK